MEIQYHWMPSVIVNGVANVCNTGSLEEQTKQVEYLNMINSYPSLLIQTKIYYIFLIKGTLYLVKSGSKALCCLALCFLNNKNFVKYANQDNSKMAIY